MRKAIPVLAAVTLLSAFNSSAYAQNRPSWCHGSLNPAEQTICDTRSLWALDDELNTVYAQAEKVVGSRNESKLKETEEGWLQARNSCNKNVECLTNVYSGRINYFDGIVKKGGF